MVKLGNQKGTWRVRDELHAIESRMVGIRKKLNAVRQNNSMSGEAMDDALKLVQLIERLAHFGQTSSAAEALEISFQIEILSSLLSTEIDNFFTS